MIEFRHACAGYNGAEILRDLSFSVPKGTITTLVGPNGCGKTTLLRAAAGQLPLQSGEILLGGKSLASYERKELARKVSFLPQTRSVPAITVGALVAHGRFPYLGLSRRMREEDQEIVCRAMEETGVSQWANRDLRELSGGERQRVYIAMALAQDTDIVFLDEPTVYLDLQHQFELLDLVEELNRRGKTVMMVLHDLALALGRSHRIILMDGGRLVYTGTPEEVFRSGALEEVFRVQFHRTGNTYYVTP